MPAFDPRDRAEVNAARGNAGYGGGGRSFDPRDRPSNAPFGGMPSFQPRRTQNPTPSYDLSWGNLAKLATRGIPGPGLIAGAGMDIAGMRPGFAGYRGQVNSPGDYDPKNYVRQSMDAGSGIDPFWRRVLADDPNSPFARLFGYQNPQAYAAFIAQNGPMRPSAPAAPVPGQPAYGPTQAPGGYLSVPGGQPYGVPVPGYQWWR